MIDEPDQTFLAALTQDGILRFPLVEPLNLPLTWQSTPERYALFRQLIRFEPSARDIHEAVIRYANLSNKKIKRWHRQSRLRAFVPSFSFNKDFDTSTNFDIDRGSTSEPDRYIAGPDDINEGWNFDIDWDLSKFIWSSDQTSIDSREKLMVELRHDLLSEATRIYHERRRQQIEVAFFPLNSEQEILDKLTRLDELTALLDAMTDGFLSDRLEKIYEENSEFSQLWEYPGDSGERIA